MDPGEMRDQRPDAHSGPSKVPHGRLNRRFLMRFRLGIPTPNEKDGELNTESESSSNRSAGGLGEGKHRHRSPDRDMRYLQIPNHALRGFRRFARDLAVKLRKDCATENPYVQALREHRAELQATVFDPTGEAIPDSLPSLLAMRSCEGGGLAML